MAEKKISRQALARMDIEALMLDEKFLRFLSTVRQTAGIETTAYGPAERHLHFVEGRRSLWCDILRTVELSSPEAILLILTEEMKASKETTNGRRPYDRLKLDDDTDPGTDGSAAGSADDTGYLDYSGPGSE